MGRDIAVHLVRLGHQVTVLCPAPSRPLGTNYSAYSGNGKPLVRDEDGVTVVRLPSYASPQSRMLPRMRESWSFGWHVVRYLTRTPDLDVIYAVTWPMASQVLIMLYALRNDIPLIWHIKDVYPESLLSRMPAALAHFFRPGLVMVDRWLAQRATHVVALSDGVRDIYMTDRHLPPEAVTTIRDWIDEGKFDVLPEKSVACRHYGIPNAPFTFLFLGNIGPIAGVELLIESFNEARPHNAQLVIAGDGTAKARCQALATRIGAPNVHFVSDPDAANVPLLQSLADVCLLPLRKGAGMSSIPSKLMAYMLSGKPTLASLDKAGDTAKCIEDAACGWVGEPEDRAWLVSRFREIPVIPQVELIAMGERGRTYGRINFAKTQGVNRLTTLIIGMAEGTVRKPHGARRQVENRG